MATLNLSTNGPSISRSYQSIVDAPTPTGPAAQSPTYGFWAIFSASAPLANAFAQDTAGRESVLKVQSTGEGELVDLIDEFSDGRIQFAFAKIKDPNTSLPKHVLIAWCGEGVPERTKGYFTSHLAAVSKTLHGYHVQITARSDRDLTPDLIVQKVSDASGSKYSGGVSSTTAPPPPMASKPVFNPTRSSTGGVGFNPLASHPRSGYSRYSNVDEDGWGEDAPPVSRTQLEKVQPSYQPTKVNLHGMGSQISGVASGAVEPRPRVAEGSNVVQGAYQPVGKVDIAEIRKQAQRDQSDDRPTPVKGAYEPVGKVDIAAIRSRAQPLPSTSAAFPSADSSPRKPPSQPHEVRQSLPDRSAPFNTSERLTSLPKPKVAHQLGSNTASFTGTKAPAPSGVGLDSKMTSAAPQSGLGRTFADQGGKTPAQVWAEKKARERGLSGTSENPPSLSTRQDAPQLESQASGGGEWKSGYAGKSWAPVHTTRTGQSSGSMSEQPAEPPADNHSNDTLSPAGGVDAIRDRFKDGVPIGAATLGSAPMPPALDISNKPNASRGVPVPGIPARPTQASGEFEEVSRMPPPPAQPPRSPTPPTPPAVSASPIRVAMPVGRGQEDQIVTSAHEELSSPPPMPARSIEKALPEEDEIADEPAGHHAARGAGEAAAIATFGERAVDIRQPGAHESGKRALVQYDYERAEDNEIELKEGEYVTNIEMVDENWWMGQNVRGESGLFPSNYVELADSGNEDAQGTQQEQDMTPSQGNTATALYDYEAAEENELSFPEHAKIEDVEFPDDDWWSGVYRGQAGLFPANYVKLDA